MSWRSWRSWGVGGIRGAGLVATPIDCSDDPTDPDYKLEPSGLYKLETYMLSIDYYAIQKLNLMLPIFDEPPVPTDSPVPLLAEAYIGEYADFGDWPQEPGNLSTPPETPTQTVGYEVPVQATAGWFWGVYARNTGDDEWFATGYHAYEDKDMATQVMFKARKNTLLNKTPENPTTVEWVVAPKYVAPGSWEWNRVVRRPRPDPTPPVTPR